MSARAGTSPTHAVGARPTLGALLPYSGMAVVVLVAVWFATQSPVFLRASNIENIVVQGTVVAVAAFGLTVVLIGGGIQDVVEGGIDLSIGAVIGLTGAVAAVLAATTSQGLAVLAAIGAGLVVGMANATAIGLGIRPLLATLAMMGIVGSVDLIITDNENQPVQGGIFDWLSEGSLLGLHPFIVILLVSALVFGIGVHRTRVGLRLHAVGGNRLAAQLAGLPVRRYVAATYLISGTIAGVAGVLLVSRLHGSTPGSGAILLLDVILASFLSTIFSRKLAPNIPGTLVGALFAAMLTNGFTLTNVPTYWIATVKGVLIIAVVGIAALNQREARS